MTTVQPLSVGFILFVISERDFKVAFCSIEMLFWMLSNFTTLIYSLVCLTDNARAWI